MNRYLTILWVYILSSTIILATNFVLISDLGTSARSIALGNTLGTSHSAEAIFGNPAALDYVNGYSLSLFSTNVMNEVKYYNIAISSSLSSGKIAFGIYEQSVKDIPSTIFDETTREVYQNGIYDWKNTMMKVAYQTTINKKRRLQFLFKGLSTPLSASLSYVYYKLDVDSYSGSGHNLDLGFLAQYDSIGWSVNFQNILFNQYMMYSNNTLELLPFACTVTAIIPWKEFMFLPQYKTTKNKHLISYGFSYKPSFLPFITLMTGVRQQLNYSSEIQQKQSFGIELRLSELTLNYAYERSDYYLLDHQSYFSLNYNL